MPLCFFSVSIFLIPKADTNLSFFNSSFDFNASILVSCQLIIYLCHFILNASGFILSKITLQVDIMKRTNLYRNLVRNLPYRLEVIS